MLPEADTEPPSVPDGLGAEIILGSRIRLTWAASSDNVAVAGYAVHIGGTEKDTTQDTAYTVYDVTPGTYVYTVAAYDTAGNKSADSVPLTVTVEAGSATVLADFGGTGAENLFGLSGWNVAIRDKYTGYRNIGPGGTTIVTGSNGSYDYQGVTGTARYFAAGERTEVVWFNDSDADITFTPRISSDDPDRQTFGQTGTWHDMTETTVPAGGTGRSVFEFDAASEGTHTAVNVSVNHNNHETLICDRIELILPGGGGADTQPPTVPGNLTAAVVQGWRIALSWDAAWDDTGVTGYEIFRDGVSLMTVSDTAFNDSQLSPGTAYAYTVRACDAAGNCSAQGGPASVTTSGGNTPPTLTLTEPDGTDDAVRDTFVIKWADDDPDDDAQISLWYDTDAAGADGTLIVAELGENADGTGDEYVWDVSALSAGDYYVYAVIDDSTNAPVTVYSGGAVTVVKDVPAPEIVSFTANPQTVMAGGTSILTWEVNNADTVSINQGIGSVGASGSDTVMPSESTIYRLTAENPEGATATAQVAVTVNPSSDPANILTSATEIPKGGSFTLSWTFSGSDSAYIDNGVGTVTENGSRVIAPEHTATYTIITSTVSGPASAAVTVTVLGDPEPQPEGSFGNRYEDLVPRDATVDRYDPERFAVITGLVHDAEGLPLPDVAVTVHAHPEYGTALTDAAGRFSVPAEGGAAMKVMYRKAGLIPAQRQVHVPWNDIAIMETLRLISEDTAATTVTFDGNPDTVVTHRSTPVTDEFGTRSATLVFQGDNRAYALDGNGNDVRELTTITARATEYATPESMPARLPPTTAHTYCAELSADGAERVRFDKPVVVWVDNFLGFPVGEAVPSGYYDRDRGVWVASENGRVVRLLDTDGDGVTDALDADGDGNPDDLDEDDLFADEVTGLDDAGRYAPDTEFWRVEVTHFTPWDFNWCSFLSLLDMLFHDLPDADEQCEDCPTETGSFVEDRSRIFHEDIPIPGTDIVRKVDTRGTITTVAGIGEKGYGGDDGPAVGALFDDPRNLAVGPDGNLYIPDYYNNRVRKISFVSASAGEDVVFSEENGLGHLISAGRHTETSDRNTGVVLRVFGYDGEGRLVSVTDPRFAEARVTTIERNGDGVPVAIISPDGLRTELVVDGNNQLTNIVWPGTAPFVFGYGNNDGLLTKKTEPEGNEFVHVFDGTGRVDHTTDQEGGRWEFSKTTDGEGNTVYETKTLVETDVYNTVSYTDRKRSDGLHTSVIAGPTGAETVFERSPDGLGVTKNLPCGSDLEFEYGTDPESRAKYVRRMTETSPDFDEADPDAGGVRKITERNKSYEDRDSNEAPDLITETVTVNGAKTTTLVHDIALAKKTVTSPENRSLVTEYDPATLLTSKVSVSGLHDTVYGYDTGGRLETVTTGTRESVFAYDTRGNLASVTDPEENVVTYDYDAVGRVTAIHRPDITDTGNETVIAFDYDENGNMTVLTNPSVVDHGFGFNSVNLNSSYTTPLSGDYSYVYDKARRLTRKDFPSGAWIRYDYDPAKLGSIETSEGDVTSFAYSSCGTKVESVSGDGERISYGYDGSLVTSETLTGTLAQTLSYTYNSDFAVQNLTYAGETRTYGYDNDGLLTASGDLTVTRNAGNGLPESVTGGSLSLTRGFSGYGETENA